MICLYDLSRTNFNNNGDAIVQPIRCELTLSINGGWELQLELPYDKDGTYEVSDLANLPNKKTVVGKWRLIQENTVIGVDVGCVREQWGQGETTSRQFFRIYDYRKSIDSIIAIAFPVACESTFDVLIQNKVFQNKTGVQVMAELNNLTDKYTLYTDIAKVGSTSFSNVNLNYALASGAGGSFVDVWGGEIVYDNYKYSILNQIGDNDFDAFPVLYGHNMTGISYERDDSGLVTRLYPISQDGVYLNGDGYVDSDLADYYPVIHKRYLTAPYQLIIDDPTNPSATAQLCATAFQAVQTQAASLSKDVMTEVVSAVGDGIPYGAVKKFKSEVIEAVAEMATSYCYHSTLKSTMQKYIRTGMQDENNGMFSVPEPEMSWHGDYEEGWWYGDNGTFWSEEKAYARNEYKYISKKWSYFGDNGYWEAPKDDSGSWDWYQPQFTPGSGFEGGIYYGNFDRYRAVNEWIYITENGTLMAYWIDGDGYYDSEYTEESTWTWHGSGTVGDPWWFGASDASSEDDYCHDQWVFIDGTLYYFDNNGYYDGQTKMTDYQWDWVVSGNKYWFGNAENHEYAALYLKSQWAKIGSDYYYFDADGYVVDEDTMANMIRQAFVQKMTALRIGVEAQKLTLYNLLYQLMRDWAEKQFDVNHVDTPQVIITVNMVDLSKTNAYANYQALEKICLGDAVDCKDYEHDIITKERVIGLTYDLIWGYNSAITIGHTEASLSSLLTSGTNNSSVPSGFDTSAIESSLTTQGNAIAALQSGKQDKLTAGDNITLVNNRINAEIEANPNNDASTALSKLRVGNTIYSVSGGGGGYYVEETSDMGALWDFYIEKSTVMEYSIINNLLVSTYSGGVEIGAIALNRQLIPAEAIKIEYSYTITPPSYYEDHPADRFKVTFNLYETYQPNVIPSGSPVLSHAKTPQETSGTITGIIDTQAINTDTYLYIVTSGWTLNFNYLRITVKVEEDIVVANPTGSATDNLLKIAIKGIIYDLPIGTEVTANPVGQASETLNKVDIGGTIYDLPSGGGGGTKTKLYTNTGTSNPSTITFNEPLTNYDFIIFQLRAGANAIPTMIYSPDILRTGDSIGAGFYTGIYAWYYYTDAQTLTFRVAAGGAYISDIYGVKI